MTTTTSTPRAGIRHRPNCTGGPPFRDVLASGREVTRCPGCGKFAWTSHAPGRTATTATTAPSATRPAVVALEPIPTALVRYVCGRHPGRPVSVRGTGCPDCQREHAERQRDRLRRRKAVVTS